MIVPVWVGWVLLPVFLLLTIRLLLHGRVLWGLLGILVFLSSCGAVVSATSHGDSKICIGHYGTTCNQ